MNPSLYPGQDQQVADLAKRIDTQPTDAKVTDIELLSFLDKKNISPDKKNISPDKNVLLETIVSKEYEIRKISGLEKAVRDLTTQKITLEDLKKPLSTLSDIQKSLILLNEGLYGGKAITWSQKPADVKNTASKWVEETKAIPVLTDELWDKYTLKRTVATISGLPTEYIVNTDEVTLWGDKKTAKISLYMAEKWKLINKEVKNNTQNNDSQTTIKFEKNTDGSRWISKDGKDTDTTLMRLQDGSQVVRLPLSDGSVKDMKVSLNNTNLSFNDHTPDRSYLNWLNNKALWNGVKLWYENKKGWYVDALRAYVDKEHKAYYIADVFVDGKKNGQNMLFDQNGKPLVDQNYEIKARWDKSKESFTTVDNAEKWYVNKNTDWQQRDLQKVIQKWNFDTKDSDTTVKEVTLSDDLVVSGYVVDHVAGESVYHIANTKSGALLNSGLTITQWQLDKVAKWEKLPVFLKGMNNYYLLTTDTKANRISLKEDESIVAQRKEMIQYYPTMLEIVSRRQGASPRYGGLQFGAIISDLKELIPQEDMYFPEDIGKKTQLIYQATVWLEKATASQKTDIIKLEGKKVWGLPEWESVTWNNFVASKQEIIVEDNNKLKIYKVGMRNNTIAFEEKVSDSAIKEFVSSYKTLSGEELFQWKPTIALKNAKWEDVWYLFDTTKSGAAQTYTAFDMKGNIISKIPPDVKTDDNKDLTKVVLDSSYEVKNKNEKIVGLTSQWNQSQELSEKIQSAPEKIKKAIETGGFQQKKITERKSTTGQTVGFILDVSKTDSIKNPATKKSKEKTSSVENTYKVYFDLNGNIDNTKSVYRLNTDGSPQITEQMKAEVVGEKLYITKAESLQKTKEEQQARDKRKELLKLYPKNGVVRIEKNNKVYEISAEKSKEFAYSRLNNPLAKQEGKYQKDLKFIQDTYNYKNDTLASYKDTPFYDKLQNLLNTDPDSFKKESIEKIINEEKELKQKSLQPLTDIQKTELQGIVSAFIALSDNFKDFDVKNAKEIKSDGTVSTVETKSEQITKPVQLDKQPTTDTTGKIINAPKIEKTSDAEDKDGKREKGKAEWSFINKITLLDANGKSTTATITVDKTGVSTVDNKDYNVVKETNKEWQEILKLRKKANPTNTSPTSSPEQSSKVSDEKESNEQLPSFTWAKRNKQPPAMSFKFTDTFNATHIIDAKNQFSLDVANHNRSKEFKDLLMSVQKIDTTYSPKLQALQNIIKENNKNSTNLVRKVQNWAAEYAGIGDKVDSWKLWDSKLGINTYTALLTALYITKSSATNPTVTAQWNSFKKYFNEDVKAWASVAHNSATRDVADIAVA